MSESRKEEINASAPWSWINWDMQKNGQPSNRAAEYLIYTDAFMTRETITTGPLTVNLGTAWPDLGHIAPGVTLHIDDHVPELNIQPMDRTDVSGWLNLTIEDEVACLLSLITGARMRTGGISRVFEDGADARGVANFHAHQAPNWSPIPVRKRIYPGANNPNTNNIGEWLTKYSNLGREDAVVLVRAARQFRDALWVAEEDPELSWLFLVSAVEGPAGRTAISGEPPAELMASEMPALAEELRSAGGHELLDSVSSQLLPIVKATSRFLNFTVTYAPPPPSLRPPEHEQLDWKKFRKKISQVYSYRSKRLHEGVPFPYPMCERPMASLPCPEEIPSGLASTKGNAVWLAKDLPMHLHMFGYIVRGCLLNWWAQRSQS